MIDLSDNLIDDEDITAILFALEDHQSTLNVLDLHLAGYSKFTLEINWATTLSNISQTY